MSLSDAEYKTEVEYQAAVVKGQGNDYLLDTLIALIERGPVWDGGIPSKIGRDVLIERGLAVRIISNGLDGWGDGYTAATYLGRDVYTCVYGCDNFRDAKKARTEMWRKVAPRKAT